MNTLASIRVTVIALACSAACAQAAVVYRQAPSEPVSTAWTSQIGTGLGGFQTFDDFRVSDDAAIHHVSWRGTYFSNSGGVLHGATPNTEFWTVEFWSGGAGGPLTQLYSRNYAAGDVVRTDRGPATAGGATFEQYDFDLDLTLDFDVMAGQSYWFSVTSKSSTFAPFFSWTNSDGPGNSWQHLIDGTGHLLDSGARAGNRAFTLESASVPEPASLMLVAGALLAGRVARGRRKPA